MDIHLFLFGVYPFIALTVFLLGSVLRFDREQFTWKTDSSQLLERKLLMIGSPLFHVGVIFIFFGHVFGLLTPHSWVQALGISDNAHQVIAISTGSFFGSLALIGGCILLLRRLRNPRVRAASRPMDIFILCWLLLTLTLGLGTIPVSTLAALRGDATTLILLTNWAQSVATFQPDWHLMESVSWFYKAHIFCGLTVFLVFPFSRLVHVWSFPATFFFRPYQVVRSRKAHAR